MLWRHDLNAGRIFEWAEVPLEQRLLHVKPRVHERTARMLFPRHPADTFILLQALNPKPLMPIFCGCGTVSSRERRYGAAAARSHPWTVDQSR